SGQACSMSLVSYTAVPDNHQESCEEPPVNPDRCDDRDLIAEESVRGSSIPIAFREILIDLNLRRNQRIFCIGTSLLLSAIFLLLFVFMLICFNHVMNKLTLQQYQNNQGLHMIPDYDTRTGNGILSLARDKVAKERYVEIIQDYIEAYNKEQLSRANFTKDCTPLEKPAHAWCRFPLDIFDAEGCSARNRYGFDNGEPCFLFELKLQSTWTPIFNRPNVTVLPLKCDAYDQMSLRRNTEVKIISALGHSTQSGFPVNKIPSRAISDSDGRDVSDENGETLHDQPALAFMKIRLGRSIHTTVRCSLSHSTSDISVLNLASLPGNRVVNFELFYPYVQ
ncbi:hypothetical protein V3C99_006601, partial [Haemonchus contortus]